MEVFAVWFLAGCAVGGVASLLMRSEEDSGVFGNVLLGVVAALAAAWVAAEYFGLHAIHARLVNLGALAAALAGAVAALALVGWARRLRRH